MAIDGTKILNNLTKRSTDILSGEISPDPEMLVEILFLASDLYHNATLEEEFIFTFEDNEYTVLVEESFITDAQYDALERMLKLMDPLNSFLSIIGSNVRGGKIELPEPLGGLDQVYEGETIKWINDNGWQNIDFVITDKMDGTSGLNVYGKGGNISIGYSRGNGTEGADITRHMLNIPDVPKRMPISCKVRVEVEMADIVFEKLMSARQARGDRVYDNPRNYTAGRMNASESPPEFYNNISVFATSLVDPEMGKLEQLQFLEKNGWKVPPYIVVKGSELTDEFLIKYLTERRSKSKYAIDGVVIDIDDADIRRSVTNTRDTLNPAYSRKFKVGSEDNVAYPQVVKVHYKKSKSAYLKPRVEIVPTSLGGVTITFLTGFNAKFIRDNNIGPGAVVKITRSGDVIPYILETTSPAPNGPELPTFEEFGPMNWTDNDVDLYLIDPTNDREVLLNQLGDMFGRMEVPHLKGGSIKKLVNAGFDTGPKIIKATKRQLQDAVGESAGEKIFDGLKNKLNPIDLYTLAGCSQTFGRGIGRRKMKKLIEILGEDDLLLGRLTIAQVIGVESFQQITAQLVVNNQYAFLDFLKEIVGYYTLAKPTALTSSKYIGVNVCFTGVRAKDLEELIVANGGKIASGVNAKTTHLVCKDKNSASGKMVKAHELVRAGTLEIIDLATARKRWG